MGNFEYLLNLTYPVRGFGLWELITAASANLIIELLESQDPAVRMFQEIHAGCIV